MSWLDSLGSFLGGGGNQTATPQQENQILSMASQYAKMLQKQKQQQAEAARSRSIQQQFMEQSQTPGRGNYEPRQQGGMFPTVQKFTRDWEGIGNKAIGGLGAYLTGRKADRQEEEAAGGQIEGIMSAVQQMDGKTLEDPATAQSLRAYLQMAGGKDFGGTFAKAKRVQSTKTDSEGNIWNIYSDGTQENTGIKADYNSRMVTDGDGNTFGVGTSGAGRNIANPILANMQKNIGGNDPMGGTAELLDREALHSKQMAAESAGDPNAVSHKGAQGLMQLMPGTAGDMEKALGLPPGATRADPAANEKAGRMYMDQMLQKYGDQRLALAAYNWGPGNVDKWLASGADMSKVPAETKDYVTKILGNNALAGLNGQAPAGAAVLKQQTAGEKAAAAESAKIDARAANVDKIAAVQGAETLATEQAKNTATAQAGLGKVNSVSNSLIKAVDDLASDPGLERIIGSSLYGRADDKAADRLIPLISAGGPAANAYAKYKHLQGGNFLQAFESLKGGGQITEVEGTKAEQAFARLSRAQSPQEFRAALRDVKAFANELKINAARRAAGPAASGSPAASKKPALPAGFQWED